MSGPTVAPKAGLSCLLPSIPTPQTQRHISPMAVNLGVKTLKPEAASTRSLFLRTRDGPPPFCDAVGLGSTTDPDQRLVFLLESLHPQLPIARAGVSLQHRDLRHHPPGGLVRHLGRGRQRNAEVALPVVYIQGAAIFTTGTVGRWAASRLPCVRSLFSSSEDKIVTWSPAFGYYGKNRNGNGMLRPEYGTYQYKPSRLLTALTSAHAQRSDVRKPFRTHPQIWGVVRVCQAVTSTVPGTVFLKRVTLLFFLRISFLSFHAIGPKPVQSEGY